MRPPMPLENLMLKCVRTTSGWRMGELAAAVGLSLTALFEIETGRAFLSHERLATYFAVMGFPAETLAKTRELFAKLRLALQP